MRVGAVRAPNARRASRSGRNDLRGRLQITSPLLRRAMVDVLGGRLGRRRAPALRLPRLAVSSAVGQDGRACCAAREGGDVWHHADPGDVRDRQHRRKRRQHAGTVPLGTILRLDADTAYRINGAGVVAGGLATYPSSQPRRISREHRRRVSLSFESPIAG
jgi:hypothetical protein